MSKAITVRVNPPPTALPAVQSNLNHLRVVLRNLLENGLKYTPTGGSIVITLAQEEKFLCCAVQDNGQGIAPDELPHVAKCFHRAAQVRQWIGLCSVYCVLYGGDI